MIWRKQRSGWKTVPLHGAHRGSVAVICCNGPSLAEVDASRLPGAGRVVLALNSAYPKVRPDYWMGMDTMENYDAALLGEPFPKLLRGTYQDHQWNGAPLAAYPGVMFADVSERAGFLDWTERAIFHWPKNTLFIGLQFALWLGCRTIYLVGVDLDNAQKDYADGSYLTDEQRAYNAQLYAEQFARLASTVEHTEECGVQWVSGSAGSKINKLMPFVPAEKFLPAIEAQVPRGRAKLHVLP